MQLVSKRDIIWDLCGAESITQKWSLEKAAIYYIPTAVLSVTSQMYYSCIRCCSVIPHWWWLGCLLHPVDTEQDRDCVPVTCLVYFHVCPALIGTWHMKCCSFYLCIEKSFEHLFLYSVSAFVSFFETFQTGRSMRSCECWLSLKGVD